jgi:hypothetical protein
MNMPSPVVGSLAAPLPLAPSVADRAVAILVAANRLLTVIERGERIDAAILRGAMEAAFGASDTSGAWDWKTAYDACEAATVLFLRKYGKALFRKAASPAARLSVLTKIVGLLPTHIGPIAFSAARRPRSILKSSKPAAKTRRRSSPPRSIAISPRTRSIRRSCARIALATSWRTASGAFSR